MPAPVNYHVADMGDLREMASWTSKTGLMRRATELGSLAAPTIVVLTGAMYLAAWAEREAALNGFGLTGDEFSHSLQTMLARGYLLLLIIGAVTALGLGILWLLIRSGASAGESETKPRRSRPGLLKKASEAVNSFLRLHFYFLTGLLNSCGLRHWRSRVRPFASSRNSRGRGFQVRRSLLRLSHGGSARDWTAHRGR